MALGLGNNLIRNGGAGNPDGLSLDLQFAADKTLTARKGPTPTFMRSSGDNRGTTYFGPSSINVVYSYFGDFDVDVVQIPAAANFNGRLVWQNGDTQFYYTGSAWALAHDGNLISTSAPTSAFRPDGAVWSGTAAVVTATGEFGIVRAANNEPRFDHDPVTRACKGLLIEEFRTNSITGSNAFNTWTLAYCTVAASSVVTPEGTADAWKVVEDILLATHSATRPFTPVSGTTYTASAWIKSAENGFAFVGLTGGGFAATFISVNLSTGAVSTALGTPIGATSVAHSNGWWRVSFSLAATAALASNIEIRLSRDGIWANRSYLGNGVNGMYCYGAQVEAGSFPTSYIPTTTGPLARSAEGCSITGSDFSNLWNTSGGTFLFEGFLIPSTNINLRMLSSGGSRRWLYGNQPGSGTVAETLALFDGVSVQNYFTNVRLTVKFKMAISVEALTCKASFNGSSISTVSHNGNLLTSVTLLGLFESASGFITGVKYYKKNLPNAKLQALTT
jgi:hypothetical protein